MLPDRPCCSFSPPRQEFRCPPPPAFELCGGKIHPVHPLIPTFRKIAPDLGADDREIATALVGAEGKYSTCKFPGEAYYRAICLDAAARLELKSAIGLYQSQRAAAIGYGSKAAIDRPCLYDGYYGSLLKDLIDSHPTVTGFSI